MTPKISLIIGIAAAALALGVPTAFAEGRLAGSEEPAVSSGVYVDANERGGAGQVGAQSPQPYQDAFERATIAQSSGSSTSTYLDAFERSAPVSGGTGIEANHSTYRDAFERGGPVSEPIVVTTVDSGRDIQWPQIGIAFGIGLVLLLGLGLALRARRNPPLAH